MFVKCFMVAVIFVAVLHVHTLNIKAVLAVTRSIAYPQLVCIYSFYSILVLVNLHLSVS